MMVIQPVTLDGRHVRLEPLSLGHHAELCDIALDEDLWRLTVTQVRTSEDLRRYIESALAEQAREVALPFATVDRATGRAIGSTRFGNIDPGNRRVEIGWTWLGSRWQRTAANTEAKYLMLSHAFERWDCNRVELKTDVLNTRSRQAMLRIGAREEGILRQHVITASGRIRDTVYYSILRSEWPEVKALLESKLRDRIG